MRTIPRRIKQAIDDSLDELQVALRHEVDDLERRSFYGALKDVDPDVISATKSRLLAELASQPRGKRFFPTVPDYMAAVNAEIAMRRQQAQEVALAQQANCEHFREHRCSSGWRLSDAGDVVCRCECERAVIRALDTVGRPLCLPRAEDSDGSTT